MPPRAGARTRLRRAEEEAPPAGGSRSTAWPSRSRPSRCRSPWWPCWSSRPRTRRSSSRARPSQNYVPIGATPPPAPGDDVPSGGHVLPQTHHAHAHHADADHLGGRRGPIPEPDPEPGPDVPGTPSSSSPTPTPAPPCSARRPRWRPACIDRCIEVDYSGTVDPLPQVMLYAAVASGDLAPYLDLSIEIGAATAGVPSALAARWRAGRRGCTGGTLADFATTHASYSAGCPRASRRPADDAEARDLPFHRRGARTTRSRRGSSVAFGFAWETRDAA